MTIDFLSFGIGIACAVVALFLSYYLAVMVEKYIGRHQGPRGPMGV